LQLRDSKRRTVRRLGVPAIAMSLALFAGACGDDNGNGATDTRPGTTAPGAEGDLAAFCDGYLVVASAMTGPPEDASGIPSAMDEMRDNAPAEIESDVDTLLNFLEEEMGGGAPDGDTTGTTVAGGDTTGTAVPEDEEEAPGEGGPPPTDFLISSAAVGRYAAENCADDQLQVTALDYEYEGIPQTLAAGTYGWLLDNEGQEWHEIVLMKKNEGVEETWEDLLALGEQDEEAAMAMVEMKGVAFAGPGQRSGVVTDLEPGEYAAVCFIPVGTTGLDVEGTGPPHVAEGMIHTFTVTAS
jgi:hypothetical protein